MSDVSIIIINYNKPDLTFDCVRSVIDKTRDVSFEIIVVDNASTKGSINDIESVDPRIRLVRSEMNLGFAGGNNLGLKYCNSDSILLLNNDTELINDAVSIAYRMLHKSKKIGAVGARLIYPDGELQFSAQRFPRISLLLVELFRLQKLLPKRVSGRLLLSTFFDHNETVFVDWLWGTFLLFKKEVLVKMKDNKLPDDFFMYNEDLQWGLEFKKAGYKSLYCPEARIIHYEGKNKFKSDMAEKNFDIILNRYYGKLYSYLYKSLHRLVRATI